MQLLSRLPGQYQASGVLTLVKSEHWLKGIKQRKVGVSPVREQSWLRWERRRRRRLDGIGDHSAFQNEFHTWAFGELASATAAVLRAFLPTTRRLSCRLFHQYPRL
jgi:hypothetical protein